MSTGPGAGTYAPGPGVPAPRGTGETHLPLPEHGMRRVVIENVAPAVDGGRFAVKRVLGERIDVEADVFADGHDAVACALLYRPQTTGPQTTAPARATDWLRVAMSPLGNDRFGARFEAQFLGRYVYTIVAWADHFETWRRDLAKREAVGQDLSVDFLRGAELARAALPFMAEAEARRVEDWARAVADPARSRDERYLLARSAAIAEILARHPDPALIAQHEPEIPVEVDRARARFSTWYELFPRSASREAGRHGSFADVEARLRYVAELGFDVLYLPPIHPIGLTERKGPNNQPGAGPDDVGSPWAIGAAEGGHTAIHPQLGTLEDFHRLVAAAGELGIEIALDIAFQASPDHPYVREHPEWFRTRPDGTIQYAENPPKKYQDIYPFHFESTAWRELWLELAGVIEFWIAQGVRIFRVDNPHTKPFAFWEWAIADVKRRWPDVIFLAEAFTRPKVMYRLAKLGFTQSYTYFAWRNGRDELVEYFRELGSAPVADFFRPNLWPNTPDILTEHLQFGGRAAFLTRVTLAATLGASYGIYGPAFELMEHEPREPGSEEYRDSEKYQLRHWDLDRPDSLRHFIARLNRIRRENPALQSDRGLTFHASDNPALLAYSKRGEDDAGTVLVVASLDPHHAQSGWVTLDAAALGLEPGQGFQAHDLLSGARFLWSAGRNYVVLDAREAPAHVFRIRHRVRNERDFDYFA